MGRVHAEQTKMQRFLLTLAVLVCTIALAQGRDIESAALNTVNVQAHRVQVVVEHQPSFTIAEVWPQQQHRLLQGATVSNDGKQQQWEQQESSHPRRQQKPLVPLSIRDFFMLVLSFCIITIAAGAGIGGGTLLVPLLAILSNFTMLEVVALSNVTIAAGTTTNILFNLPRKHPSGTGPLLDYDLLLLFCPTIVIGSVIASHLNYFIPGWITKILVMLLLLPMAWRTIKKARFAWVKETKLKKSQSAGKGSADTDVTQKLSSDEPGDGKAVDSREGSSRALSFHRPCSAVAATGAALLRHEGRLEDRAAADGAHGAAGTAVGGGDLEATRPHAATGASGKGGYDIWQRSSVGAQSEAGGGQVQLVSHCRRLTHDKCAHTYELELKMEKAMERQASAQYPKLHLLALGACMAVVLLASVCANFLVRCGTWQYWTLTLMPIPAMCLIWAAIRWHVLWCVGWRECLYLSSTGEVNWTPRTTLVYPAIATLIGALAGLLGLGGSMFMLLELGVHPSVAAASSQVATQIGMFAACVIYLVNRAVPPDYGLAMVVIGLTGALHGQLVINYLIGRTNRPSIVVMTLAALFIGAVCAAAAVAGMAVADVVQNPYKLTLTNAASLCRKHT